MKIRWSYGVTTVPSRRTDLFPATLASLKAAGFGSPRLYVDGEQDSKRWADEFGLDVTARHPAALTYGNWVMTLWDLWIREPNCDRYAIFQDDFETYPNLREYLDSCPFPARGYWNLYTFPFNQEAAPKTPDGGTVDGWYEARDMPHGPTYDCGKAQYGKGAVALVFDHAGVQALLGSSYTVIRPMDVMKGHKAVDGHVVTAMNAAGYREYVHSPSLVQHTGMVSSMGNRPHRKAESFRGTGYDARELIKT